MFTFFIDNIISFNEFRLYQDVITNIFFNFENNGFHKI